ncbi:MAG: DegT/DnrJ/EryC1/StrS family aminotransferase [Candidatus Riflebacteria bacterium]|nr:DegT/DnrJ/EryC1/StrS family aminotransferase [Candidatus Riflebacteria bacterium]
MIQMNVFTREPECLIEKQIEAINRVIRSGSWILGKEVQEFEVEWASWCDSPYVVGVGNGMDALEIGLRALGIGDGDEVITTSMTAFATVLAIIRAGATPVLADIDSETAILAIESVARCVGPKTKAVIVVHLYGQAAPLKEYKEFCHSKGLFLIEDCAQAHGTSINGIKAGTAGIFGAWSFYPTKNLGTIGDAGAISTSDKDLAKKAGQLRNYGQSERFHHPQIGLNSRLDEIHAAILKVRLTFLKIWIVRRREIAQRYYTGILNPLVKLLKFPAAPNNHVYHLFVITSAMREQLSEYLKEKGIETLYHYPVPIHNQNPCKNLKTDPHGLLSAEKHASECLSLPCNPFLTNKEIDFVIYSVNKFNS